MFDFEKLTKSAQSVIIEAQTLVKTNKNSFFGACTLNFGYGKSRRPEF